MNEMISEEFYQRETISLTTQNKLFIEQNAYRRAQEYYNELKNDNYFRDKELRHKNAEIVKRKQDLILLKGTLPSSIETKKIKMENQKIQEENEITQNIITKIKSQIQQYNDLYDQLNISIQNQINNFEKLEQVSLDHSYTAEQVKNIHMKAIKKYEKIHQRGNDLIHAIYSLQNKEKKLLKKKKRLDLILSEPLDNIELEEFLTKDSEDTLSDLESRERSLDDSSLINEIEKELAELEILFRSNQKRQKSLSVLKNSILTQSQSSYSSFINDQPKRVVVQSKKLTILNPKEKVKINEKIENIIQNLNEKNKKCLNESLEVDQLSNINLQKSKELEKQYQIKILKIQNLKDQIDFANDLSLSIQEEQKQILFLTRKLQDINADKEGIKHANSVAFQSRKVFESKKDDLERLRSLLSIRMKELNENEIKINKRKVQYQKDQEYLDSQMEELDQYEQNVYFLEDQARIYEDKIKENCIEINESYSIIDEKTKLSFNTDRFLQSDSFS